MSETKASVHEIREQVTDQTYKDLNELVQNSTYKDLNTDHSITCVDKNKSRIDESYENKHIATNITNIIDNKLFMKETSNNSEIFRINFPNKYNYEKYGQIITEILKEKFSVCEKSVEYSLIENSIIAAEINEDALVTNKRSKNRQKENREQSPDLSGLSDLFKIDTVPQKKLQNDIVPSYKRVVKLPLLNNENCTHNDSEDIKKCTQSISCFNCGLEDHSVRECPQPLCVQRIYNAKKNLYSQRIKRYHIDVAQRFGHLRPGNLTPALRSAMGLKNDEVPFFFYRMRSMGYPPGWLEDAKVEPSGITLFNSEGTEILGPYEKNFQSDEQNPMYNLSKIVDFPGFNKHPEHKYFDDYLNHKVPKFSRHQLKEHFIKTLGVNVLNGYKRRKLQDLSETISNNEQNETGASILEVTDMEIEDINSTTDNDKQISAVHIDEELNEANMPTSLSTISSPISVSNDYHIKSLNLQALENQQKLILKELQEMNCASITQHSINDNVISSDFNQDNIKHDDDEKTIMLVSSPLNTVNNETSDFCSTPQTPKSMCGAIEVGATRELHIGTPILKFSQYDSLPNGNKFKVGVSDVINFENLADSTGKYEQMKKVIKKVRKVITKLQDDENR